MRQNHHRIITTDPAGNDPGGFSSALHHASGSRGHVCLGTHLLRKGGAGLDRPESSPLSELRLRLLAGVRPDLRRKHRTAGNSSGRDRRKSPFRSRLDSPPGSLGQRLCGRRRKGMSGLCFPGTARSARDCGYPSLKLPLRPGGGTSRHGGHGHL